jgi:hypothetical protein
MGVALRTTPLLVIGLALIGCGKDPAGSGPGQTRTKADQTRTDAASNLPTVTLKIPGMS